MSLSVAVQLYSVRDNMKADMRGTLKEIKKMGYAGVEFAGLFDHKPEEVKAMCEEIGLVPVSAHVPYVNMLEDVEKVFSDYSTIGGKYVAIPHVGADYRPDGAKFLDLISSIPEISKVAKKYGITLLYHNHDFEFTKFEGKYGLDYMYETVSADDLQTELDVCWVKVSGEDPAAYIRKYSGRTPIVHLKDYVGTKNQNMYELIGVDKKVEADKREFEFRPVGSGVQDFPAILKASEDSGATWVVVEQDRPSMGKTAMECAKTSIEYLKKIGY